MAGCSGGETSTSAKACHDLAHDGSSLTVALASNPPPDPAGGTLTDGTYVLTAARLFKVPNHVDIVRQLGGTLEVKGAVIQRAISTDGTLVRGSFTYTISGTTLTLVDTCGSSGSETYEFIATPTQIELLLAEPGTPYTLNQVFTKR